MVCCDSKGFHFSSIEKLKVVALLICPMAEICQWFLIVNFSMNARNAAVAEVKSDTLQVLTIFMDHFYYRAMHVVLARYCYRKSSVRVVRPSVRLSVTLRYAEHIGWTSSKLITRIISLGSSLLGRTTSAI